MSDEQPPEVGSRRRRREIREARERARTAQRERESAVRRLSSSSTADEAPTNVSPALFDQETQSPKDERTRRGGSAVSAGTGEMLTRRELRRLRTQQTPVQPPAAEAQPPSAATEPSDAAAVNSEAEGEAASAVSSPSTPFEQVVAPHSAPSPEDLQTVEEDAAYVDAELTAEELEELSQDHHEWDEYSQEHIERDEDGTPVLVTASGFGRSYQTVAPMEGRMTHSALKRRRAKRRRRNVTLAIAAVSFAALVIGFVAIVRSILGGGADEDYDTLAGDTVEFGVVEGDGLETVANRLMDEEIIASRDAFWDSINDLNNEPLLQPGTFEMREQMPAADAVAALFEDGEASHYFGLAAGTTVDDALEIIAENTDLNIQELQDLNADPQQFGLPEEAETLEGYLAAGEYRPELDATAEEAIEMMVAPTFERLEEIGVTEEQEQWETIIVASLITAEANHEEPDDYPLIAGAIENRLQPDNSETDGLLQIDAAVNYGLEGSTGLHFTEEDRQDDSNPYNTYQHVGLPPGPIAAPAVNTLEPAANPADTDYFYWVTVNIETGETEFSETYEQHLEYEQQFLEYCADNPGVCDPGEVEAAEEEIDE